MCHSSRNLLGCVGLIHGEYSILNTRYSKEEFEKTVVQVYESMRERGEWGEFFPEEHSWFDYQESRAFELWPLSDDEAREKGYVVRARSASTKPTANLAPPESIGEAGDSIVETIFSCEECSRGYKIIRQELAFLRKMQIALPTKCPQCRRNRRSRLRPTTLCDRVCSKCGESVRSVFSPSQERAVLCERCVVGSRG